MAKKRSKRIWWFPTFVKNAPEIKERKVLGNVEQGEEPMLFSSVDTAYSFAIAKRMEIKHDENGDVVTDGEGYGQFEDFGKIALIGIRGKDIDWKKVIAVENVHQHVKGEAIFVTCDIPYNKQTMYKVFEESDEQYNKFALSPIAQAGGIKPIVQDTDATEDLQPTTEH